MSHILRAAVLAAVLLPFPALADQAGKSPAGVRYHGGDEIILQGFHWNVVREAPNDWYNILRQQARRSRPTASAIWMPVPGVTSPAGAKAASPAAAKATSGTTSTRTACYGSDAQLRQAAVCSAVPG